MGLVVLVGLVLGAVRAPQVHAASGAWTMTGKLNEARSSHTATLLPSGHVLVAGGNTTPFATFAQHAELYDPATETWQLTGSPLVKRSFHTATLLLNGQVLVAGGSGGASKAEVYHPTTETWHAVGDLNVARDSHTATLLPNGYVLVAGGRSSVPPYFLTSAELYDPIKQAWTLTASLNVARYDHSATLLSDGTVLVVGGPDETNAHNAEIYDPATGVWTLTENPFYRHEYSTVTSLPTGDALVVGGSAMANAASTIPLKEVELYDIATGHWYVGDVLHTGRVSQQTTRLSNGKVLVTGGRAWTNTGQFALDSTEVFDPTTLLWTQVGALNIARSSHTLTLLPNGKVLVAGGHGTSALPFESAELYDAEEECAPIEIFPLTLPEGTLGTAYAATFTPVGSSGAVVWEISSGDLPNGITLNAESGELAGTPTDPGTFSFMVHATDGSCLGERTYTLIIKRKG